MLYSTQHENMANSKTLLPSSALLGRTVRHQKVTPPGRRDAAAVKVHAGVGDSMKKFFDSIVRASPLQSRVDDISLTSLGSSVSQ